MIKTENIIVRGVQAVRTYSDAGMMIRQVETGNLYDEAVDVQPCRYSYEETDTPVPDTELSAEEALKIIVGGGSDA